MIKRLIIHAWRFGVDSYSFHRAFGEVYPGQSLPPRTMSTVEFLALLQSMNVQCCALETCFLPDDEELVTAAVKSFPGEVTFAWGHPNGFMDTDEAEAKAEIIKYLRFSNKIGANLLRVVGSGIRYFHHPHRPQMRRVIRCLKSLVPYAEDLGVRVALENHGDFSIDEIAAILGEAASDQLGAVLDTGNALRLGERPQDDVMILGDKLLMVHAKDLRPLTGFEPGDPRGYACVPAGEGVTDFPALFRALEAVGFSGMILSEMSGLHPDVGTMTEEEIVRRSVAYLRSLGEGFGG